VNLVLAVKKFFAAARSFPILSYILAWFIKVFGLSIGTISREFSENSLCPLPHEKGETIMFEEKKDKTPVDLSHPSIGGRKVGHWVPSNQGKEIDFSSIPGVRCVMPPPSRVEPETKPAESVEKEGEGRKRGPI